MQNDAWGLLVRDGLPEHLRVLADLYPREGWAGHSNFDDLTRFWLERHLMFRRLQGMLLEVTEASLDGADPRETGRNIHRLAGTLIGELHTHHGIEDHHYFPMLKAKDARLVQAFELLDRDHHAMDGLLEALVERTNGALQALGGDGRAAMGALREEVVRFETFLNRHLTDEEEIVVPVILEHGGADLR
ncbi:MAG: hemerythrin domain-containing protein [Pseudomonadota bacterium]